MARCLLAAVAWHVLACGPSLGGEPPETPADRLSERAPTFHDDIAPILHLSCTPCHHPGGPAPFSLIDDRDATRRGAQIARVTRSRFMPPWKAEPGYGEFEGVRRLDEESIRLIEAWVSNGMPVGQRSEEWAPPHHDGGWILGEPDLVVEMAESIEIPADGPEIFRRFRIPLGLDETKYLEALEFRPSNPAVVHHVVIVALNEGERVGGDGLGLAGDFLEAWTPGAFARPLPDGVARVLEKGARLQLQMHLRPSGKVEQERPRIGFHFAAKPPIHALSGLRLGSSRIEIPPGTQDYRVTDSVVVPADAEAIGIIPHAHYICREMSVQATPPGGEKIWLLRITDWDFNWQEHYRYASPVPLPRGTLVEMEFTYDNSSKNPRNPFEPPRKIQWGQLSSNEMAILYIEVLPKNPADLPLFKEKLRESKRRGKR